jgi:mediator of RNA polymerase II transcription subunit 12
MTWPLIPGSSQLSLLMLEYSTTTQALAVIMATFRRYLTIWTCMSATGTIANSLYAAHQVWKTRGLQSRDLLALLVEMDNGQFLDAAARAQVVNDIAAFTHVSVFATVVVIAYVLLGPAS